MVTWKFILKCNNCELGSRINILYFTIPIVTNLASKAPSQFVAASIALKQCYVHMGKI